MSTFYSLFDLCDGERVAMRATRFVKQKSMLFTFIGWCSRCEQEHTIGRRAPVGSFKTNTNADPRRDVRIHGTQCKLKVPYSMSTWEKFAIGHVRFEMIGNGLYCKALDPIPASWFVDISVDISVDVIESTEAEELEFDGADLL